MVYCVLRFLQSDRSSLAYTTGYHYSCGRVCVRGGDNTHTSAVPRLAVLLLGNTRAEEVRFLLFLCAFLSSFFLFLYLSLSFALVLVLSFFLCHSIHPFLPSFVTAFFPHPSLFPFSLPPSLSLLFPLSLSLSISVIASLPPSSALSLSFPLFSPCSLAGVNSCKHFFSRKGYQETFSWSGCTSVEAAAKEERTLLSFLARGACLRGAGNVPDRQNNGRNALCWLTLPRSRPLPPPSFPPSLFFPFLLFFPISHLSPSFLPSHLSHFFPPSSFPSPDCCRSLRPCFRPPSVVASAAPRRRSLLLTSWSSITHGGHLMSACTNVRVLCWSVYEVVSGHSGSYSGGTSQVPKLAQTMQFPKYLADRISWRGARAYCAGLAIPRALVRIVRVDCFSLPPVACLRRGVMIGGGRGGSTSYGLFLAVGGAVLGFLSCSAGYGVRVEEVLLTREVMGRENIRCGG